MPRAKGNNLLLKPEEYQWIVKEVGRCAARLEAQQKKGKRPKLLKEESLLLKLNLDLPVTPTPAPFEYEQTKFIMPLTRNELRIVQKLVRNNYEALLTQVIPGYSDKINLSTTSDDRARYLVYIDEAVRRSEMLASIQNEIGRRL